MNSIEFNNLFFIKYFFNYIIKIYSHKIQHQPKNKSLFETVITLKKAKNNAVYFSTILILKDKLRKKTV
jgi:hypothetical protein